MWRIIYLFLAAVQLTEQKSRSTIQVSLVATNNSQRIRRFCIGAYMHAKINPLIATSKPHSNGPS